MQNIKFQATVLIVNLANNEDRQEGHCHKYWPENGSQIHGSFEVGFFLFQILLNQ